MNAETGSYLFHSVSAPEESISPKQPLAAAISGNAANVIAEITDREDAEE
ncbi:hypothetical protein [Bradyrhizobium viridifuturi]|nr:hypothetical protein [Bradyrhizobium viridifuturi]